MLALKGGVSTILICFSINTESFLKTGELKVKNESQLLEFHMAISVLSRRIWPFIVAVLKISFICI